MPFWMIVYKYGDKNILSKNKTTEKIKALFETNSCLKCFFYLFFNYLTIWKMFLTFPNLPLEMKNFTPQVGQYDLHFLLRQTHIKTLSLGTIPGQQDKIPLTIIGAGLSTKSESLLQVGQ